MHSINNLVGREVVDESKFNDIRDEFGRRFGCTDVVKSNLTTFNLYGEHVPLYAIRKLFEFPSYTLHPSRRDAELKSIGLKFGDVESPLAITWDCGHIWAMRRLNGVWHSFDSRVGRPSKCALPMHLPISFVYAKSGQCATLVNALRKKVATLPAHMFFNLLNLVCGFGRKDANELRALAIPYARNARTFPAIRARLMKRV